jgi:hypothetical protein
MQDSQLYYKEYLNNRLKEVLLAYYAICYSNAFKIFTTIYKKLIHASKTFYFYFIIPHFT